MGDTMMYAVAALALLVLGFAVFATPSQQPLAGTGLGQAGSGYQLQQQVAIPPDCGDINNPQNLQHLSHHPDRFQACYKVVDPAKFKAAVGRDVSEFIQ